MDSDIHFGEIEQASPRVQLRPDRNRHFAVVPVYEPSSQDLPIFVDVDVFRDMELHAESDSSVELGGVLLGGQFEDENGRPFVVVSDSLRAQHFESTKGSFKFTHDTWEDITRRRETFPPDLQMVGWYHTHPGWGIFLSGMDMFICDNFFNKPLDVALVIDPVNRERGIFQWTQSANSRIRKTDGFFLTGSRFRAAELQAFAAQLEGSTNMSHDPRQSVMTPYSTPIIQVAAPAPAWQLLAVLGMLSLQFCLLMLVAWHLAPVHGDGAALRAAADTENGHRAVVSRDREADLDAKLQVLETIVRQGSKAPEGVVQSLVEKTALVEELRTSLRAQQSLGSELDDKILKLEASVADAKRRDERQQSEFDAIQSRLKKVSTERDEFRNEFPPEHSQNEKPETATSDSSWWASLRMNSMPLGLGAIFGAIAAGAVAAAMQHAKRTAAGQNSDGAVDRAAVE